MIKPLINSLITGLIKPLIGDIGSLCNVYLFSSAKPDSLEIESFTGNLKVMIAAPSEAGINPAIIAGRQGDFVASPDPVNEPTVIQYEIDASAITQIVSPTFNGIVYKYYKDNVKYSVNMGKDDFRSYYDFDGVSASILFDTPVTLSGAFSITGKFIFDTSITANKAILGSVAGANWFYLQLRPSTGIVYFRAIGQAVTVPFSTVNNGLNDFTISRNASNQVQLKVNGTLSATVTQSGSVDWEGIGAWGNGSWGTDPFEGSIFDIKLDDGAVVNFPINDGWDTNPVINNTGSGTNGTANNFIEGDWYEAL